MARNKSAQETSNLPQDKASISGMPITSEASVPVGESPLRSHGHKGPSEAVKKSAAEPAPPPKAYRVVVDSKAIINKCRVTLHAGKVITEANYDIVALKRMGVRLEELEG
jgi:hypothetical protein